MIYLYNMIDKLSFSNSFMDKNVNNILLFRSCKENNPASKGLFDHRTNPRAHISSQRN